MTSRVSKSQFKPHALEYFRQVEATRQEIVITDHGRPVVKIVPYADTQPDPLEELRRSVIEYEAPTEPVGLDDWEGLR
ncbi:MAG: type II toxin-antitoxin system Phd/YefM family antitoxin [Deferrisomatales bacterium]